MKKMKTIFTKNLDDMSLVTREKEPTCDWVFNSEGMPHRKYDGTCCLVMEGALFKRRTIKKNKEEPLDFIRADFDVNTGKFFGWVPVNFGEDKFHLEAYERHYSLFGVCPEDGTYELLGPKIQGNVECFEFHTLRNHLDTTLYIDVPLNFIGMREWFIGKDIEGLVFHHADGRKAKIRKSDFGLKRDV